MVFTTLLTIISTAVTYEYGARAQAELDKHREESDQMWEEAQAEMMYGSIWALTHDDGVRH